MATFALGTLIKIGLVATGGTAIVVPMVLSQKNGTSLPLSHSTIKSIRQPQNSVDISRTVNAVTSSPQEQHISSTAPTEMESSIELESPVPLAKKEEINKKCFVIPANSSDGRKLLTCLENENVLESTHAYDEEYNNSYYLYDSSEENSLTKVEGNLMWSPDNNQISVQLKEATETTVNNDGIFTAKGEQWKGISDKEADLLQECVLFGYGTAEDITYKLVCGNDTEEMSQENPKGIPLSLWQLSS